MILSRQNSTAAAIFGEQISQERISLNTLVNLCSLALLELSVYNNCNWELVTTLNMYMDERNNNYVVILHCNHAHFITQHEINQYEHTNHTSAGFSNTMCSQLHCIVLDTLTTSHCCCWNIIQTHKLYQ